MTVTITPGPLYIVPNPAAPTPAQIVGTGNQWADDSDATYGEATNTRTSTGTFGEAVAAPLTMAGTGTVTALDVTLRGKLTTNDTSPPQTLGLEIRDASDVELVFLRWDVPSVDTIYDVSGPSFIYPSGQSLTTLISGIAAGGAYAITLGNPPDTVFRWRALTVYELDFLVTSVAAAPPPLRRHPRSYLRKVPAPPSNRHVGGYK
jgi:hypothetical protein